MIVIFQLSIIFAFLALGELTVWLTGIPVPSSVVGMLLLAAALQGGVVKLRQVEGTADFLVRNLGFFFVPAGVGLMEHFGLIREQWLPIVVAAAVSTGLVLGVTGGFHQLCRKYLSRNGGGK